MSAALPSFFAAVEFEHLIAHAVAQPIALDFNTLVFHKLEAASLAGQMRPSGAASDVCPRAIDGSIECARFARRAPEPPRYNQASRPPATQGKASCPVCEQAGPDAMTTLVGRSRCFRALDSWVLGS